MSAIWGYEVPQDRPRSTEIVCATCGGDKVLRGGCWYCGKRAIPDQAAVEREAVDAAFRAQTASVAALNVSMAAMSDKIAHLKAREQSYEAERAHRIAALQWRVTSLLGVAASLASGAVVVLRLH